MIKSLILLLGFFLSVACSPVEQSSIATVESLPPYEDVLDEIEAKPSFASATELFARKARDEMVDGEGRVIKLLADDNKGSRHQRFLLEIVGGQTLLFAHNIDLALRIDDLQVGDRVQFRGEYVYNQKGGVVHWTHLDPQNRHEAGWIKHRGITYQ
jgi:hypothetical protein